MGSSHSEKMKSSNSLGVDDENEIRVKNSLGVDDKTEMKVKNPLVVEEKTELKLPEVNKFLPLLVIIVQLVFLVGKQDKAHVKCTCERFEQQTHGVSTTGLSVYYCQFKATLTRAMSIVRGHTIRWLVDKLLFLLPAEEKSM